MDFLLALCFHQVFNYALALSIGEIGFLWIGGKRAGKGLQGGNAAVLDRPFQLFPVGFALFAFSMHGQSLVQPVRSRFSVGADSDLLRNQVSQLVRHGFLTPFQVVG